MKLTPAIAIARKLAGYVPPVIDGEMCCANCGAVECKTKRHKRYKCILHMFYVHSRGVCAKLREALFASRDFIDRVLMFLHGMETTFPGENEIIDKIRSALGEAPKMAPDPRSHVFKI